MNDFLLSLPAETYTSWMVVILISIFSFFVYQSSKKVDPLKKPKGIMLIAELIVYTIERLVKTNMGRHFNFMTPYFLSITLYIFIGFLFGLTGLSSPLSYYMNTFTIVLISFILIHYTAIKTNGWKYFKRFIEPFPVFLPINLVSIWAPLVSMSFRIFGNILSGFILMSLIYFSLGELSSLIFTFLPAGVNSLWLAPLVAPWFHLYFDLFSALIQTLVFISLSMLFIAQEGPARPSKDEEEKHAITA
jgi:F-type H+-transporting ATPase subunit a